MNYLRIYNNIIYTAQQRTLPKDTYKERHHFIPRCMNGPDDNWNIVKLTAKEHYISHHILTKIYPHNSKIWYAFWLMCNGFYSKFNPYRYKINSATYNRLKLQLSKITMSVETRNKIAAKAIGRKMLPHVKEIVRKNGLVNRGKTRSAESRDKVRQAKLGKHLSPEHKEKIRIGGIGKGMFGKHHSAESKLKIGIASANKTGRYITPKGIFNTSTEAAKANGFKTHASILKWCKENRNGYSIEPKVNPSTVS